MRQPFLSKIILAFFLHFSLCQVPVFHVRCDKHYDCFFDIGQNFQQQISTYLSIYKPMNETLLPFYQTHRDIYDDFVKTVHTQFSSMYDEIRGLADGVGVDFHLIMLLILKTEILAYSGSDYCSPESEGCTDLLLSTAQIHIRAHNEDGDMLAKPLMFFVDVKINDSNEHLMFFNYPGLLPGNAYGWNKHGLVFSENYVGPRDMQVSTGSIPTYILTRHIVSSKTADEAIQKMYAIRDQAAFGFNMNIFDLNKMEEMEIEVAPGLIGVRSVSGNYSHMNNYKFLDVPYRNSESSVHRQKRVDEFSTWESTKDMRTILGDVEDKDYPIYRNNDRGTSTLTTVVFDFDKKTADVYLRNPKLYEKDQSFDLTFGRK